MNQFEFESLSEGEQIEVLYYDGVFIGKTNKLSRPCLLFQIDTFYVEVVYEEYRKNIKQINIFDKMELVDPYLKGISIEIFE